MEEIMVSILCNVYNHENYLRQTLDGFVTQKTGFPFEVLVHDDASPDHSADIIREYAAKYPEIVKPVCQTENQLSQGVNIYDTFQFPRARGKYIAFCEGDDCWIDDRKLAKQVAYMESHPECTFCFTNGIIENVQNGKRRRFVPYTAEDAAYMTENGEYDLEQMLKLSFLPFASFLFPFRIRQQFPEVFRKKRWGADRKIALYTTALGYAFFLDEPTCVYHYGVRGSAMTRKKSKAKVAAIERSFVEMNNDLDCFTQQRYHDVLTADNLKYLRNILMLTGDRSLLSEEELRQVEQNDTAKQKIVRFAVRHMPESVFNFFRAIKRKMAV